MSRIRLLVVSMLGVVALTAISAATASAQPTIKCEPNGTTKTLSMVCVQNSAGELLTLGLPSLETIELLATKTAGTESELKSTAGLQILCSKATSTALADGTPAGSATLIEALVTFTGCTVDNAKCTLNKEEIKTELLIGTPLNVDGVIEFKPAVGELFAEFIVRGEECAVAKTVQVKGSVEGNVLENGVLEEGADTTTKTLEFEEAEGLTIGGGEATKFTLFLTAELDKPGPWTGFAEHPPFGIFLTETIS